ncbi:DUF2294 domain-containing protein [Pleurocapsales cyanobacterium LEGE 10410]|nr:DUF2294 domain-containing protein [Pleurocapsales cyanobacterium LEGE 10410]
MNTNSEVISCPTVGQLERTISQRIRTLYRDWFGHQPSKVECHVLKNKIVISLEDVITPIEKLLVEAQPSTLVTQVRSFIDETIKNRIKEVVEEISQVSVTNCLYNTEMDTGYAGAIIILADSPQIRTKSSQKRRR